MKILLVVGFGESGTDTGAFMGMDSRVEGDEAVL